MTETTKKFDKVAKENPKFEENLPARRTVFERSSGMLNLPKNALDPGRAYRWALQDDVYGRDDYGDCFEMGYRDTQVSSLKGFIKSDSTEKVIRKLKTGTFILMDAPIHYRQLTADELAQKNETELHKMMRIDQKGNGAIEVNQ